MNTNRIAELEAENAIAKDVHLAVVRRLQARINELEAQLKRYERRISADCQDNEERPCVISSIDDDYGHLGQRI